MQFAPHGSLVLFLCFVVCFVIPYLSKKINNLLLMLMIKFYNRESFGYRAAHHKLLL